MVDVSSIFELATSKMNEWASIFGSGLQIMTVGLRKLAGNDVE
jgi:hypothetical protein